MAGPLLRTLWSSSRKSISSSSSSSSSSSYATYLSFLRHPTGSICRRFSTAAAAATSINKASDASLEPSRLRNVAVIAHVDHGKTTLMDRLLRQCGADIPHERAMDSISLERERGITIDHELNMVDTPGHADFGGEVERVVGMVEGAILVVDAGEGPLAQTKFVLAKALKYGLRPILLLNKVDRPSVSEERCNEVESLVFDLFANLDATEEQLDFPVLYASAKEGWASSTFTKDPPVDAKNMSQLLDAIIGHVPSPKASIDAPFQMMVSMMEKDYYLGRILTGRVSSGLIHVGDRVHGLQKQNLAWRKLRKERSVVKLMKKKGTSMVLIGSKGAGDIISMAGMASPSIGHLWRMWRLWLHYSIELDPPTISMTFGVNDSPLAAEMLTGGKIGDRLMAEAETNLAINVLPSLSDSYEVQGRGELQLGILIENMRREGFELSVSPPKVMYKTVKGQKLEPIEEVIIEVNDEHVGLVMESLSHRRAEVVDMGPVPGNVGRTRLSLSCPSRGLVGYRSMFSSDTRGTGFMHRAFLTYAKYRGPLGNVRKGVLVSMGYGTITSHALMSLEARGTLFVTPGMETYDGMIVGEHSRDTDLDINPVRTKELTNVRAATKDENVKLSPPRLLTRERNLRVVMIDEQGEDLNGTMRQGTKENNIGVIKVTPKAIRMRKDTWMLTSAKP
ncbi:hypothetical protein K2173_014362 [Erythroxylum novogranatense]|uniref:Tr-type G domain-containing protein n=1 Tax=Erythroxylum novogranatense TaxID=1862640 RepID=A0AAV8S606_9ROSI|nr:hypothetical protein K2173_014362 [Erythroxylum novogranatense]